MEPCNNAHLMTLIVIFFSSQKLLQISEPEGGDKEESSESQPYRPGIKRDIEPSKERPREREDEEEEEEDEEKPSLPTPRKRLMNFKIPLVRGSQRRDQQQTVVARRRLYNEEQGKRNLNVFLVSTFHFCEIF